jgi:peptide/nickel transport system substrate-binding protein
VSAGEKEKAMQRFALPWLLAAVLTFVACAPAARPVENDVGTSAQPARAQRPLAIVLRTEPVGATESASSLNRISLELFSARLTGVDAREVPHPVLAEALPQLNTDSWRVFPDGRMETTFRLRPGLTFHDGSPLTADSFVFGWQVHLARMEWGHTNPNAEFRTTELEAIDPLTLLIRWSVSNPDAATSAATTRILPLPRHLLETALAQGEANAFGSLAFWTTEYVGAGPYRLARWEPGAYIEGTAFDGYVKGPPKIDRVRLTWSGDPNSTVARLLSGDADIALDTAIQFQQAAILRQAWSSNNEGTILLSPTQARYLQVQFRDQYVKPRALLDLRVRKAIQHAIDRKMLADTLLEGEGIPAETLVPPTVSYYAEVDRVLSKYAFDPRQTETLMGQAGFTRAADGMYADASGSFSVQILGSAEGQEAQETTILADFLRRANIDAQLSLLSTAQLIQSDEEKATFPGLRTNYATLGAAQGLDKFMASKIAAPENRWSGSNKIGWADPEYDRFLEAWTRALDPVERRQNLVQLAKIASEQLPYFPLYYNFEVVAHVAKLTGPQVPGPDSVRYDNVHAWELR